VTLNEHVEILFAASLAVYVTTVVPFENTVPGFLVLVSDTMPAQLSEVVGGVQVTVAWHDAFAFTTMSEGQPERTGLIWSWTVTLNVHVDVLPAASAAV
jgi:hypothetical protein